MNTTHRPMSAGSHSDASHCVRKKALFLILPAIALVAVGLVLMMHSPASDARDMVTWEPTSLYWSLAAGESTTTEVAFTAGMTARDVSVEVAPEVAEYVSVSPGSFSRLRRGRQYEIAVTITAPADALIGVYDGTLDMRQGRRRLGEELPVDLTVAPIPLPPDPGEAGKLTIEGIDFDGDGVRDDVQRWIALTYPEDAQARAALTQGAYTLQQALLIAEDKSASIEIARQDTRAAECLMHVLTPDTAYLRSAELESAVVNTESRSRAYIRYNEQLGGEVFPMVRVDDWAASCSFDYTTSED